MEKQYELNINLHVYVHGQQTKADVTAEAADQRATVFDLSRLSAVLEQGVDRLQPGKSAKTKANYVTALRSFIGFYQQCEQQTLSAPLVEQYQYWLKQKGASLNTISCYMRSLRSLLKTIVPQASQLFDNVFTGNTRTDKRAICQDDILRLQQLQLPQGTYLALARDVFLFCFYAQGMPFVDAAHLKKSQLADNRIVYARQKTGQRIAIYLEPCMVEIIQRYQDRNSDYVFPILTDHSSYDLQLNHYNRALKRLATMAKIGINLTSYVARHSWASIAYSTSVELPVISKALGHTNPQTTLIYIKEIGDDKLKEANHEILKLFQK